MFNEFVPKFSQYLIAKQYNICEGSNYQYDSFFAISEALSDDKKSSALYRKANVQDLNVFVRYASNKLKNDQDVSLYSDFSYEKNRGTGTPTISNLTKNSFDIESYVTLDGIRRLSKTHHITQYITVKYNVNVETGEMNLIGELDKKINSMPKSCILEENGKILAKQILDALLVEEERKNKESEKRVSRKDNRGLPNGDSVLSVDYHNGVYKYNKMQGKFATVEQMQAYTRCMNESIKKIFTDSVELTRLEQLEKDSDDLGKRRSSGEITMDEYFNQLDALNKEIKKEKARIRAEKKNGTYKENGKTEVPISFMKPRRQEHQVFYIPSKDTIVMVFTTEKGENVLYMLNDDGAELVDNPEEVLNEVCDIINNGFHFEMIDLMRINYGNDVIDKIITIPNIDADGISMKVMYQEMCNRERDAYTGEYDERASENRNEERQDELNNKRGKVQFDKEKIETSDENIDKEAIKHAEEIYKTAGVPLHKQEETEERRAAANESFDIFNYISKNRS